MRVALILLASASLVFARGGKPPALSYTNEVTVIDYGVSVVHVDGLQYYIVGPDPAAEIPATPIPPAPPALSLSEQLNQVLTGLTNSASGAASDAAHFLRWGNSTNAAFPTGISTNFWLRSLDGWNSIAYRNSAGDPTGGGTLISPQHMLTVKHANAATRTWLHWWGTNGASLTNYTRSYTNFGPYFNSDLEVVVCLLSNAMPASAQPAAVADTNLLYNLTPEQTYIMVFQRKAITQAPGVAYWMSPQIFAEIRSSSNGFFLDHWLQSSLPGVTISGGQEIGDSGYPAFICHTNRAAVIGLASSVGTLSFVPAEDIKAAMDDLSDAAGQSRQPLTVLTWTNETIQTITLE